MYNVVLVDKGKAVKDARANFIKKCIATLVHAYPTLVILQTYFASDMGT